MKGLLAFSRVVDALNQRLGWVAEWLVLLSCLISAGNAFSRYAFGASSNAWLEIQWYMFAAVVLLGASYTLKKNEHVRVDIVYANVSTRRQIGIDIFGFVLFMLPAKIFLPIGFALLTLQGVSELIKRIAMLTGDMPADLHYERPLQ